MSQVVVDTDVASYIFWHSSAQRYVNALRGAELILSFMSIAEMRMGAIAAGWGVRLRNLLEQFIGGFGVVYADDALYTSWAVLRAGRARGRPITAPPGRMDRGNRVGARRTAGHEQSKRLRACSAASAALAGTGINSRLDSILFI